MKNLILIFALLISTHVFCQKTETYKSIIVQAKENAIIDKSDETVLNFLNEFYEQGLQSETQQLAPDISQRIGKLFSEKNAKNTHILTMFIAYQDYISQTVAVGKPADSNFQVELATEMEQETRNIYGKVPTIVSIYKIEALNSNGQNKEAAELVAKELDNHPNSIPLKVYHYLNTKDENIKADLINKHVNHWMVKQFNIK